MTFQHNFGSQVTGLTNTNKQKSSKVGISSTAYDTSSLSCSADKVLKIHHQPLPLIAKIIFFVSSAFKKGAKTRWGRENKER